MLNPERESPPPRVSLSRRVLNAGGWLVVVYGFSYLVRLGSSLLMTRLLMPEMFGVMSVANIVLVGLGMFSDLGLKQCIVRSERGHDPAFLNTVWVIQILQGGLLWLAALGISLLIRVADAVGAIPPESAYANPILPLVIAVLSSVALVNGFGSTKFHEASRKLLVGRVAVMVMVSQVAALLSMLAWVSVDRSVWALVAGGVASAVTQTFLSQLWLAGPVNRWHWDGAAAREIIRFGKWMFLSSILGFLVNNGDRLLLGGLLDAHMLGIYSIAFLLFSAVEQVLATVIGEVMFPALSEIARERRGTLKASYYRLQIFVASLAYAAAGVLAVAGGTIVSSLYDQRYQPAGWMLEILAFGLLATPWRSGAFCFVVLGMPQILSQICAARLAALVVSVFVGFHFYGLAGALCGIVAAQLVTIPVIAGRMAGRGLLDLRMELLAVLALPASMLIAKTMVAAVLGAGAEVADGLRGAVRALLDALHLRPPSPSDEAIRKVR